MPYFLESKVVKFEKSMNFKCFCVHDEKHEYLPGLVKTACTTYLVFRGIILRRFSAPAPRHPETAPASTAILCSEV